MTKLNISEFFALVEISCVLEADIKAWLNKASDADASDCRPLTLQ